MSKKKEALPIVSQTQEMVSADHADIRNMIHLIRGQQVITTQRKKMIMGRFKTCAKKIALLINLYDYFVHICINGWHFLCF